MRRKKLCTKHFSGKIDITDPGYDNDDIWRTTEYVKDGDYTCYVWRNTYKDENKEPCDVRVGVIGIYLNGEIPRQQDMVEVDMISVDSGLAGFFMDKQDYTDEEWSAFCDNIKGDKDAWEIENGVFSKTGFGDGRYPLYCSYNDEDEVVAMELRFL